MLIGKPYGKRIDGSRDALQQKRFFPHAGPDMSRITGKSFFHHAYADKAKKKTGNPWDIGRKELEYLHNDMHTDPSRHRHKPLEKCKNARHKTDFFPSHARFMKTVRQRNRKSIHRKTGTEEHAAQQKYKVHIFSLSENKKPERYAR